MTENRLRSLVRSVIREDEDELTMDDLPDYDTPEMPDQEEAEYDGKEVTLYDPFRIDDDEKKYAVYVRNPDTGNVNKLKFGSGTMEIKRDSPGRLKSFRERFSCDEYGQSDKHKATFWSCLFWRKDLSVSDILSENKTTVTESEVRRAVRQVLTEAVQQRQVFQDIQSFTLPKSRGDRAGRGRHSSQPVRANVQEDRNGITFELAFRNWGYWSAPKDDPRIGPQDRDSHDIDREDLSVARSEWEDFISQQPWASEVDGFRVFQGEKQYLYFQVFFDPEDVEGFERTRKRLD